ncbi:MAG: hypothetical protein J6C05_08900 [Prevotella sp.]|nr:hypothetical protein [Prevotella sp.]MBO5157226.1 hypothetical protein [Prevotella sp.]
MKKSDVKLLIAALKNLQKASRQLCRAAGSLEKAGGTVNGFRINEFVRDVEGYVDEDITALKIKIVLISKLSDLYNEAELREIYTLAR